MRIEHIAIWVSDLEACRAFYEAHFAGRAGEKYVNAAKGFESYFVSFAQGARLELMRRSDIDASSRGKERVGLAHFAVCVGNDATVDSMTKQLEQAGVSVVSHPRRTGDGYYESVVLDPEGNRIEIVAER